MNFLRGMAAMFLLMKLVGYLRHRWIVQNILREGKEYEVVLTDLPEKE